MGQKRALVDTEKSKTVKCLSGGSITLETAKLLRRDHHIIKRFVANSQQGPKKCTEKKRCILTAMTLEELNVKLPGTHYPPVELQPAWSIQKYKVSSAKRHSQGKEG